MNSIYLLALLFVNHYLVDFIFQTEYQWKNKNKFLHPGGLIHSGLHGLTMYGILIMFGVDWYLALKCSYYNFIIHYAIDYFKMEITIHFDLDANRHKEFWWVLGLDQLLHYLTYLLIAYIVL